jgi:hypothetical protein
MRPGVAILAAAILAMPARALAAEQEPNGVAFRLEYTPRPGCIDRETFANEWLVGEFGQEVVFDDARAFVRVTVKRKGPRPEAHVSAFDEKGVEHWHIVIPTTIDCRELMQDVAYSMAINLGKWDLKKQPAPEWLLRWAPLPEVGTPASSPRPRAFVAMLPPAPRLTRRPVLAQVATSEPAQGTQAQDGRWAVGGTIVAAPYGLPGVGLGGGLFVARQWPLVSTGVELRALGTLPAELGKVPVRAGFTFSVLGKLCFDTRIHISACGVLGGGTANIAFGAPLRRLDSTVAFGLGGVRVAVFLPEFSKRTRIGAFGELLAPIGNSPLQVSYRGRTTVAWELTAPILMAGFSIGIDPH